jgi:hypothetical protein
MIRRNTWVYGDRDQSIRQFQEVKAGSHARKVKGTAAVGVCLPSRRRVRRADGRRTA